MQVKYLIIGAGPTGLGAAHRLNELGEKDFIVLEANPHAGGLSASFKDEAGFTWDIGGHVIFSHYPYFDDLLNSILGNDYTEHRRIARIRSAGAWTPYPYQNNIRYLPKEIQWECVEGLLPGRRPESYPSNFEEWIYTVFGEGLAKHFMLPYNFKVWAYPPKLMSFQWIGERVSVVDLEAVLKNLILQDDNVTWGPNSQFRFPLHGGTGEIFRRMAARFNDRIRFNTPLAKLDLSRKCATTQSGEEIYFTSFLSTAPLDLLAGEIITGAPDKIKEAASWLEHSGVYVAGVGTSSPREDDTCWMYFPEKDSPFYRVTNLHNYSPNIAPAGSGSRALLADVSFSKHKREERAELKERILAGLSNTTLLEAKAIPHTSFWSIEAEYGYPTPTPKRDRALAVIQPWLQENGVYSRGRFGGWRYEVGNMDHSVMQGVEWADLVVRNQPETIYKIPDKQA